ncbi:acetate--CoA ligase family protein [Candidatus Halocynthiibacter alkanivorans]|uniref:acetate--CoA ligase family protein n=1 Tax=Candidatus Halocynthiibacter alkanivorans TaxID=2267619 RepID=UPI000DF312C4|nr:acetate--CoA ligase family protein [Candidatus Halocynthiibacter alkanivorans]
MQSANRLQRLFRPRSIAVVGGGPWGVNVIDKCREIGYQGEIWPVHPTKDQIAGLKTFASVADLPGAPDAAFVGVNRNTTIQVVRDLNAIGAGGAVCFASGFLEAKEEDAGASALQDQLLDAAGDMKIIGPNCYGFVNYLDGALLWPDQHGGTTTQSGVAIVTQSSNIAINLTMQQRGLPIAYVVTAGNQAQTGLSEIGTALLQDDRVTALGLHIEGIDDLRAFEALADTARSLGKPIVALKVGKSSQAQVATISHTASLAGSDAGATALLRRLGIGQVTSIAALVETLKLLHVAGPLSSARIVSMSCSGGEASLMADSVVGHNVTYPPLNTRQTTDLRAALGPMVALANPLDYNTYIWGDEAAMTATFSAMMDPSLALGCVVLDFPRADRCNAREWDKVINAVAATQNARGVPMAILASLPETMPEPVARRLVGMGIAPLSGIAESIEAIAVAAWIGQTRPLAEPVLLPCPVLNTTTMSEADGKAALQKYGVNVPASARVTGASAAGEIAEKIGFPVVLKGEGIAHKTEAGAVALNLTTAAAVRAAAASMPCDSFLIEEMITGTLAELLVGVVLDPAHGYVLTLAAGGTLTELLADSVSLIVPASAQEVQAALNSLKLSALLHGYRGAPAADMDAITATIMALQTYVTQTQGRLAEAEINPLMCGPDRAIAADVLIKIGEKHD